MTDIFFKKISYFISFSMLSFLAISSNVSATSINGFTLETGHANTNQKAISERWAIGEEWGGYVPECGWPFPSIGDIDVISSYDWNFLYSKNSYKVCNREVQNGNYRFYLSGGIKGQCTSCVFSRTYDSSVYCYDYSSEDLYLKLVAGTATKKYTGVLPQWVINGYDFCELGMPTKDSKVIDSGETSYTLKPICNDEKAIKSIQVNATVWISSAIPPSAQNLLINGTTPTYIYEESAYYYEGEQLYYWYGSLAWEAPVGKKCTEITNLTITPSISNGYAYAIVGSINAIYQDNFINISLNPSEIYPNKAGSLVSSLVIAKLVDNEGNPLSGYQINFQSEIIESKGHAHTNTRNPGVIDGWCVTDEDGQCSVNYYSSIVAGKDKITAYLSDYPDVKDSKEIAVKVPGLIPLYEYVFYYFTGQTASHPSNHYGTTGTNDKVANVAWDYSYETNALLGINDMSLEWGGLFDIDGDWSTPHKSHRKGTSVDIDRNAKSLETLKYVAVNKKILHRIATYYDGIKANEATIHYDFY